MSRFKTQNGKFYYEEREVILDNYDTTIASLVGSAKKNGGWNYDGVKFKSVSYSLFETFNLLQYDYFDVKDREVVDIGAGIGDSPIFFALKEARKVYAFEPLPAAYQEMIENIKLNGLEEKIVPINAAVGVNHGKVKVPKGRIVAFDVANQSPHETELGDFEVPVYSLDELVNNINDPYLLKIDCEGCEINLISDVTRNSISRFEKIIFEHHNINTKVKLDS